MKTLFIIGAPRSGTNALRDSLVRLPGFYTWNCDELNYIWRALRPNRNNDVLSEIDATPADAEFIIDRFRKLSSGITNYNPESHVIVEKTCANCLRISYLDNLFTDAKFLYIKRSPYDAIYSAVERWTAVPDPIYLLKKIRYIPFRALVLSLQKLFAKTLNLFYYTPKNYYIWGPRIENETIIKYPRDPLSQATLQWRECTSRAEASLASIESRRKESVSCITYEEFVHDPATILYEALQSLGLNVSKQHAEIATSHIFTHRTGRSQAFLESELNCINKILGRNESE